MDGRTQDLHAGKLHAKAPASWRGRRLPGLRHLRRAWRRLDLARRIAVLTVGLSMLIIVMLGGVLSVLTWRAILEVERQEARYQTRALAMILREHAGSIEAMMRSVSHVSVSHVSVGGAEGGDAQSPAGFINAMVSHAGTIRFAYPGLRNLRLISLNVETGHPIGEEIALLTLNEPGAQRGGQTGAQRLSAPLLNTSYGMAFVIRAAQRDPDQVSFDELRVLPVNAGAGGRAAVVQSVAVPVVDRHGRKLALLVIDLDVTAALSRLTDLLSADERYVIWPARDDPSISGVQSSPGQPVLPIGRQAFHEQLGRDRDLVLQEVMVTRHGPASVSVSAFGPAPLFRLSHVYRRSGLTDRLVVPTLIAAIIMSCAAALSLLLASYSTSRIRRLIRLSHDFARGRRDFGDLEDLARSSEENTLIGALEGLRRRLDERGEMIRRMAERLNLANDAAGIGIWEYSGDETGAEFWSDGLRLAVLGRAAGADDGIENSFLPLRAFVHPDDVAGFDRVLSGQGADGPGFSITLRLQMAEGGYEAHQMIGRRNEGAGGGAPLLAVLINVKPFMGAGRGPAGMAGIAGEGRRRDPSALTSVNGAIGLLMSLYAARIGEHDRQVIKLGGPPGDPALRRIVDDLRDLALADAGQLTLNRQRVDLARIVAHALDENHALLADKKVSLRLDGLATPSPVFADPDRLLQVMRTLLSNAIRFSPEGGDLRVSLEGRGRTYRVSLRDFGPGIGAGDRRKLFCRFAMIEPAGDAPLSAAGTGPGLGLGLAVARELIRAHHGVIGYRRADPGSIFYFDLLRADAPD